MTKWFLCAVDGWNTTTTTQNQRVGFLTCWDDAEGSSQSKTQKCATAQGLDMATITACESGSKGEDLQQAAAEYFEETFPSHAHSGMFQVPHIFVNGVDQGAWDDYDTILANICATGISAGACSK